MLGKPKKRTKKSEIDTKPCWLTYAATYRMRYHTWPLRNASVNTILKNIKTTLITDAERVIFYYLSLEDDWLIRQKHPLKVLYAQLQRYHTDWEVQKKKTGYDTAKDTLWNLHEMIEMHDNYVEIESVMEDGSDHAGEVELP